jgi:thiol-disulfide isomerase/thioredoxin
VAPEFGPKEKTLMKRRSVVWIGALMGALSPLAAGETPDAREIVTRADAALKAVKRVTYDASSSATGILARRIPVMSGTVTLESLPGATFPKLRVSAKIKLTDGVEPVPVEVANDGRYVTIADFSQNVYIRRPIAEGGNILSNGVPLLIREFTTDRPLDAVLNAVELKHEGTAEVAGVECDIVHAVHAADGGEARWHIARTDHLPRRVERIMESQYGPATLTISLTKLDTAPQISEEMFEVKSPEGFTPIGPRGLIAAGATAPDFKVKDAKGQEVTLKGLRGKVVVLDFWATWCGPCRMAMPGIQKLYEKFKDKPVAVYGVNCWQKRERRKVDPAKWMKEQGFTYPLLLEADELARAYRINGIPAFYMIDPAGKILMAYSGYSKEMESRAEQIIEAQLKLLERKAGGDAE